MRTERDYWIETVDRTFLYYKLKARSKNEALEKFLNGECEYVGCNDECNERGHTVLGDEPYMPRV